jgi:hypothetical protein
MGAREEVLADLVADLLKVPPVVMRRSVAKMPDELQKGYFCSHQAGVLDCIAELDGHRPHDEGEEIRTKSESLQRARLA